MLQMPSKKLLQEKWAPILQHEGMDKIKDNHRAMVTAQAPGEPRTSTQRREIPF